MSKGRPNEVTETCVGTYANQNGVFDGVRKLDRKKIIEDGTKSQMLKEG